MLAEALEPHGGIVMWRAFVYSENPKEDRHKQAYTEFQPLDGTFRPNVLIQVKNGPIDLCASRSSPLFGAMPRTPLMLELQITKDASASPRTSLPGAALRGGASRRHVREGRRIARSRSHRRVTARVRAHGNRRSREHGHRSELVRRRLRLCELARIRPAGLESIARVV